MKKLIVLLVIAFGTTTAFAQEGKNMAADHPEGHQCYMMKDAKLMHCDGKKASAVEKHVKLDNGTVVQVDGKIVAAEGKEGAMLKDGQCIDLEGNVGDCEEMHAAMKKTRTEEPKSDQM